MVNLIMQVLVFSWRHWKISIIHRFVDSSIILTLSAYLAMHVLSEGYSSLSACKHLMRVTAKPGLWTGPWTTGLVTTITRYCEAAC